jgi:hypothetical protein
MPLLFSYGTLQQEKVQLSTFGRRLEGRRDELPRYELSSVKIEDPAVVAALGMTHHANVTFTGNEENRVSGIAFEVTEPELVLVDAYEAPFAYERVAAVLASGRSVWVYAHTPRAPDGPRRQPGDVS